MTRRVPGWPGAVFGGVCRGDSGEYDGPASDAVFCRIRLIVRSVITVTFFFVALFATPAAAQSTAVVAELEERFELVVEEYERWDDADLSSLLRGAEALPEAVWDDVETPVALEYVERPCLFSMGRYNDRCPTFDGSDRFFIYDEAPIAGQGSVERLAVLSRSEQRDVQIRRAVVHLAMAHLDEQRGWSDERRWQAINGWLEDDERALNRDPRGYSRYLGMQSAHLDLVTFAEEYFVRPEDVLRERRSDAAVDPDDRLQCIHFTRRRVFRDFVADLDERWTAPDRWGDEDGCEAFEKWAMLDQLECFEVWYAPGADSRPESLFGHLLLQVRYEGRDGDEDGGVYRFELVDDEDVEVIQYYMRRVLGGFTSTLGDGADVDDLGEVRRYELRLDDEQARWLMERLWEAERTIRYPYHFAAKNGAAFLAQVLEPAVDRPVSRQGSTLVMPTDVLDALASVHSSDRRPLIEIREEEATFGERVLGPSGRHRWQVGGAVAPETGRWTGRLNYARLAEDLGEARRRGVRPDVGVRVLAVDASVPVDTRDFRQMRWDLTVFRYESLERPRRPNAQGLGDRLGWRVDGTILHDGRRDVWAGADLRPSVLMPLVMNSDLRRHLLVFAGPALGYDVHRGHDFYAGAAAGLVGRLHLYGSPVNALRFGVEAAQYTGIPFEGHHDVRGDVELRHTVARRGGDRWIAAPYVEGLLSTRVYGEADNGEVFDAWEVGLRLEAPF